MSRYATISNKIADYTKWLEVAVRSAVVLTEAFHRKFERIEHFIVNDADGFALSPESDASIMAAFNRLVDMYKAVTRRYDLPDLSFLRDA